MKLSLCSIFLLICGVMAAALAAGTHVTLAGDTPARIRIIYTNDTLGYLEPCGCGGRYEGGLARRTPAIARLVKGNPNSLILDSGNISDRVDSIGIICSLMASMGYDAVGVGKEDAVYMEELIKQASSNGLKVIDASQPKSSSAVPYLLKNIANVKIGVVSFGANTSGVPSAVKAFESAYKAARTDSDVLILLDQGGIATKQWLEGDGKKLGVPDIVIGRAPRGVATKEQVIGTTHILPTSDLGRHVGVADIKVAPGSSIGITSQLILINKTTDEDPKVARRIETFLLGSTRQAQLKAEASEWGNGAYLAPEECKGCHADVYNEWRKTKHAKAVSTLVSRKRMIPDCLPCHSEEYRQTLKTTRSSAKYPTGVECASCHASVLPHGPDGPGPAVNRKVDPKICATCHTPQRSPAYNPVKYMKKASHPGIK